MGKWLDRAHALENGTDTDACANSANGAERQAFGSYGAIGTVPLPAILLMGLNRAGAMKPPTGADPAVWNSIITDAMRLSDERWASTAMALGWSALDLFGLNSWREGLAIWLAGRRIVLLDTTTAVVENGDRRAQFTRCREGMPDGKLLWDLV